MHIIPCIIQISKYYFSNIQPNLIILKHTSINKIRLICNNLLCYLAVEYVDTIINSELLKKEIETRSTFDALLDSKKIKEENKRLENEILMLLLIKKRKRCSSSNKDLQISKRPYKYNITYETNCLF